MSRPGAGEDANGQIIRALLYALEDHSVGQITQVTDGVTFGVEEDNSLRVVREVLEAEGDNHPSMEQVLAICTQPIPNPTPG